MIHIPPYSSAFLRDYNHTNPARHNVLPIRTNPHPPTNPRNELPIPNALPTHPSRSSLLRPTICWLPRPQRKTHTPPRTIHTATTGGNSPNRTSTAHTPKKQLPNGHPPRIAPTRSCTRRLSRLRRTRNDPNRVCKWRDYASFSSAVLYLFVFGVYPVFGELV